MADRFEPIALQPTDWYRGLDHSEAPISTIVDNGYAIEFSLTDPRTQRSITMTMNHTETSHLIAALGATIEFQRRRLQATLERATTPRTGTSNDTNTSTEIPPAADVVSPT